MQKSATMKVVNVGAKPLRDMGGLVQQNLMQNTICTDLRVLVYYVFHWKPLDENNFMNPFCVTSLEKLYCFLCRVGVR